MKVVVHQAVRMANPAKPFNHPSKRLNKAFTINIVKKYLLARVTSGGNVVKSAGKFNA
jgi:hypothetical protein